MIGFVVAPVLQEYVPPPDAVRVVVCPLHTVVFPVMEAVGLATVTITSSEFIPQEAEMLKV